MKVKLSILLLAIAGFMLMPFMVYGQEKPAATQEVTATPEEYAYYEKASQEQDLAKKQAIILEFFQKYPKSQTLDNNMVYEYNKIYQSYYQAGNWQALATAAERYLSHRPSDVESIKFATLAYQKLGNSQKLIDFGTKLFRQSPNANTAYFVAKAYQANKDNVNFVKWAEQTVKFDPPNLELLVELIGQYWQIQDWTSAGAYSEKALKAVETARKPEGTDAAQWTTYTNGVRALAFRALGERAYQQNNIPLCVKHLEASLKLERKVDYTHYRLAACYWRNNRVDEAMMSFARAYVLNGPTSKAAYTELTNLYQTKYRNTQGVANIVNQARAEMK
jgi:tetratricopeptide (TPR) repeat protein